MNSSTFTLKNVTAQSLLIPETGLSIGANSSVDILKTDLAQYNLSTTAQSLISASSIVVNNGEKDLNPSEAKQFLSDRLDYDSIYSPLKHTHKKSDIVDFNHDHNTVYYTQNQIDDKFSSINYSSISTRDGSTNVTGAELEALTNGSNADALHTHSFPSLDKLTLDQVYRHSNGTSQISVDNGSIILTASNGFAPLKLTNSTTTPAQGLSGGQIFIKNNIIYVYDDNRQKWLSIDSTTYQTISSATLFNGYLSINGNTFSSSYGVTIPFDATIIAMSFDNQNSEASGRATVRSSGQDIGADLFFNSQSAYTDSLNIDIAAGSSLQTYIDQSPDSGKPTKASIIFYLKRRA